MPMSRLFLAALLGLSLSPVWAQAPANGGAPKGASTSLKEVQQTAPPPAPPVAAAQPPAAAAPKTTAPKAGEVLLNFQAADIQAVVKAMSQMTRRNFLLDPRVKGQITIISSKPVSTASAYQIFLSALKAQGFTAIEGIGATRIVPTTEGKANADVLDQPYGGERIMTHVAIVQHSSATQVIPLLRPLMSPTSQLSAHEPGNALIITDYADNIRRLLRIIEKIDQPVSTDVSIITLKHASALDLADLVTRLSLPGVGTPGQPPVPGGGLGAPGDRFTIIPDLRTNSLLVRADNPGRVHQIRSLIEKLDVPATRGGQTRVVYLRNADAVKLADVLRGLLAGEARTQQTAAATPAIPGAARAPTASRGVEASLIQADEATNALIINAPDATYNNLRAVIEKLDVRRTQVYIEAMIVEMTTDAAHELGIQWATAGKAGSGGILGVQNFPNANPGLISAVVSPETAFLNSGGLLLGFLSRQIQLPDGTTVRTLGALARALEQQNMANILSTPNLMTLDNAEAKIVVGQNVPFVTGSFAQATGTTGSVVNPFQTIERKDVGLTLKVKPQVSEGGVVKLDLYQEVSSVAPASGTGASDLITNKRSLETKVVVDDGNTIILGGLIEDSRNESEQSVPVLGRIPLIGGLFRYKQKTGKRTNLMVFLRPVIIYGPQDAYGVTADRYEYLRAMNRGKVPEDSLRRLAPVPPSEETIRRSTRPKNFDTDSTEPANPARATPETTSGPEAAKPDDTAADAPETATE